MTNWNVYFISSQGPDISTKFIMVLSWSPYSYWAQAVKHAAWVNARYLVLFHYLIYITICFLSRYRLYILWSLYGSYYSSYSELDPLRAQLAFSAHHYRLLSPPDPHHHKLWLQSISEISTNITMAFMVSGFILCTNIQPRGLPSILNFLASFHRPDLYKNVLWLQSLSEISTKITMTFMVPGFVLFIVIWPRGLESELNYPALSHFLIESTTCFQWSSSRICI